MESARLREFQRLELARMEAEREERAALRLGARVLVGALFILILLFGV